MMLAEPYETTWHDGRKVTIYPNGKIEDTQGNTNFKPNYTPSIIHTEIPQNNQVLILAIVSILTLGVIAWTLAKKS